MSNIALNENQAKRIAQVKYYPAALIDDCINT